MRKSFGTLLGIALVSLFSLAKAATYPLPGWSFSGSGFGSWSGSSSDPTMVFFFVFGPSSGSGLVERAFATSSTNILTINSNTIYTLTCSSMLTGPGDAGMTLIANGVASYDVNVPSSVPWTNYSTSFTTSGPSDPRVGAPLLAQCHAGAGVMGGANVTFTNITLNVSLLLPKLTILRTNLAQVRLSWSTNFNWYALESATNINSSWLPVTNASSVQGSELVVNVDLSQARSFFRLRQP